MTKSCRLSLQSIKKKKKAPARRAGDLSPGSSAEVRRKRGTVLTKKITRNGRYAVSYLENAQTSLNR